MELEQPIISKAFRKTVNPIAKTILLLARNISIPVSGSDVHETPAVAPAGEDSYPCGHWTRLDARVCIDFPSDQWGRLLSGCLSATPIRPAPSADRLCPLSASDPWTRLIAWLSRPIDYVLLLEAIWV